MKYVLTKHAREVLEKRQIPVEWLEIVLENPQAVEQDKITPTLTHYLSRIPGFNDRVLRVIVNPTVDPHRISSVYFDRRMKDL